jgi:hypothetical protein
LARHRLAFEAEERRELAAAEAGYAAALRHVEAALASPALAAALEARVARYPLREQESAPSIVAIFLRCLPDWLIEVHRDRCAAAFKADLAVARAHWALVLAARGLGRRSYQSAVGDCRGWLEAQFFPKLSPAPSARAAQLEAGERLLRVDAGLESVRTRLVLEYAANIHGVLDQPAEGAKSGHARPGRRRERETRRLAASLRGRAPRYARRLRRHAMALARPEADEPARREAATAFRVLAAYWRQEADEDQAIRMSRRARRLGAPTAPPAGAAPAETFTRPAVPAPPALRTNPFKTGTNPYRSNPLRVLGVGAEADDFQIGLVVGQMVGSASLPLDPRLAERMLRDRALRLAYDLMMAPPPDAGAGP